MHLQPGYAVDDLDPRLAHLFGRAHVVLLIEARLELHEDRHTFAIARGTDQGVDHGRVFRHAILRDLDLLHVRIERRLHEEAQQIVKRLIGKMQQHVAPLHGAKHGRQLLEIRHSQRCGRRAHQLRPDGVRKEDHVLQVHVKPTEDEVVGGNVERPTDEGQHIGRHLAVVHEAAQGADLPLAHLRADRLEDALRRLFVDIDIGIARDLNPIASVGHVAGKDGGQVVADHVVDKHEVVHALMLGQGDEARHIRVRYFDQHIERFARLALEYAGDEVEAAVADEGAEALVERDGREVGEDLFVEIAADKVTVEGQRLVRLIEIDALATQLGQDAVVEDAVEILLLTVHLGGDLVKRLLGLLGIVGAVILFHDSAALIGHAYLIELLQVGGVDGEEANPLIDG